MGTSSAFLVKKTAGGTIRRRLGVGRGCSPPYWERGVPLPRKIFHFWSSKSLVCCILIAIFLSSSTTDGLLWDDLSGSIAQGNKENPQDPNGRSCFLTCRLYKSTVLFLIPSFNPHCCRGDQLLNVSEIFIRN